MWLIKLLVIIEVFYKMNVRRGGGGELIYRKINIIIYININIIICYVNKILDS